MSFQWTKVNSYEKEKKKNISTLILKNKPQLL